MGQKFNISIELMLRPFQLFPQFLVLLSLIVGAVDGLTINLLELIDLTTNGHVFFFGLIELLITLLDLQLGLLELGV